METFFGYIIAASICLAVFYLFYFLFMRNETGFIFIRFYLVSALLISMLLPLNKFSINIFNNIPSYHYQKSDEQNADQSNTINSINNEAETGTIQSSINTSSTFDYLKWIRVLYFIVLVGILVRILIGFAVIFNHYHNSIKEKYKNVILIKNERLKCSFSFFNIIFINIQDLTDKEIESVIAHENIHVSQFHTIDLALIELLSAVMWFNPFVWLLRKSLRQVHEYLADEGVLNTGFDKLEYQALLVNQVAESRLISLATSFNQSQIKNRIFMMTKLNSGNRTKLKILALVPITAVLLIVIACVNGQNKTNVVTAVEPVRMNVLYIGVENPIKIAASGYEASDLSVTIDNGTITGSNGEYVINPKQAGTAVITVSSNGKEIQKTEFRVKVVPDPVAVIKNTSSNPEFQTGGNISKEKLLTAGGINVVMRNFDFDIEFKVVSFVVSATLPNSMTVREEISKSDKFSEMQADLIKSLIKNQKLMIEEVKAIGPDGSIRKLNSMVFTISGV